MAGELSRKGYPVSITMGNANSVNIYAESSNGILKIDANLPPEYFIVSGAEIISGRLIKVWEQGRGSSTKI